MSGHRVVALLGSGVVPPDSAIVRAIDAGALHGDGLFETMHVRAGRPWLPDEHLARMESAAGRLAMPLPPRDQLADLAYLTARAWHQEEAGQEGALRLVCPFGGPLFATVTPVADAARKARIDGVRVITADAPVPEDPFMPAAKSLSYAVSLAHLVRARGLGADDVLWINPAGAALEGATSALVWLDGHTLCFVPTATDILASVTAGYLRSHAGDLGATTRACLITPSGLFETGGAWLLSSVRGAAAIRTLNGAALPYDEPTTRALQRLLGFS